MDRWLRSTIYSFKTNNIYKSLMNDTPTDVSSVWNLFEFSLSACFCLRCIKEFLPQFHFSSNLDGPLYASSLVWLNAPPSLSPHSPPPSRLAVSMQSSLSRPRLTWFQWMWQASETNAESKSCSKYIQFLWLRDSSAMQCWCLLVNKIIVFQDFSAAS